jgi:hypothetical protein
MSGSSSSTRILGTVSLPMSPNVKKIVLIRRLSALDGLVRTGVSAHCGATNEAAGFGKQRSSLQRIVSRSQGGRAFTAALRDCHIFSAISDNRIVNAESASRVPCGQKKVMRTSGATRCSTTYATKCVSFGLQNWFPEVWLSQAFRFDSKRVVRGCWSWRRLCGFGASTSSRGRRSRRSHGTSGCPQHGPAGSGDQERHPWAGAMDGRARRIAESQ